MGITVLLMIALVAPYGTFSFEHPMRSAVWRLGCWRVIFGWSLTRVLRIDQCMYGLKPRDCLSTKHRYLKPTRLVLYGNGRFVARCCGASRSHLNITGNYRKTAKPLLDPRKLASTQPNSASHLRTFMRALFEPVPFNAPDEGKLFDDRCLAEDVQTLCRDLQGTLHTQVYRSRLADAWVSLCHWLTVL